MEENNKNFILAVVLSMLILLLWQVFYGLPKMREEQARQQQAAEQAKKAAGQAANKPGVLPGAGGAPSVSTAPQPGTVGKAPQVGTKTAQGPASRAPSLPNNTSRESALGTGNRLKISSPLLQGSLLLKGARLDDLSLLKYRQAVAKDSSIVELLSPAGSAHPYYVEYGWVAGAGEKVKLPDSQTLWKADAEVLSPGKPVTLTYDNGQGLIFRRILTLDDKYLFDVRQEVENKTRKPVTLYPYALVSRHGQPATEGIYVLHEGLIGVLGEEGLEEIDYSEALEKKTISFTGKQGWLGITDKYWAVTLIPDQAANYQARFSGEQGVVRKSFQADYLLGAYQVPAGGKTSVSARLFAGAKQVEIIDSYEEKYGIKQFELLIDWGWFYFITKPLFYALDYFYKLVGNFGVSILIVTVLIKLLFFPLANKSYVSMSKLKLLQPEMQRLRQRYKDDTPRMQQELMKLYQKEGVNPMSGCLPILVQIPVFFALYKVLYVTIDMRHAPFFGWIQDLSAPDPTSLFNLFGLLPFSTPQFLTIGIWPILMGITMWVQMRLNPQQGDPIQQQIFNWMPVVFTVLLATFPAGLVIYWVWNNLLSIAQQWFIMARQGVKVDLLENTGFNKLLEKYGPNKSKS